MKLSEAMRRGARMGPQAFGRWQTTGGGGCALVSTMNGCGIKVEADMPAIWSMAHLIKMFPELTRIVKCSACIDSVYPLDLAIIHMNDYHHWSRERIAGWIEAHVEVPTYSMLQMQGFMADPSPSLLLFKC